MRLKGIVEEENFPKAEFNVSFQAPITIAKIFPFRDGSKNMMERSYTCFSRKQLNKAII